MTLWVGTSGFAYREWKGSFYPEDLKNDQMLSYYGERLNSVEINNTFYRMPNRKVLADWVSKVPESFSFVLKASRKITHFKKLKDTEDELGYLVDVSSELGDRLGPTLFQLPPYLKKDAALLGDFLAILPDGFRAAFEFRSSSWFDDDVYGLLEEKGVALVTADTGKGDEPPVVRTADYGYARLRRERYEESELQRWTERLSEPGWDESFVFFKHEDGGAGPALAAVFRENFVDYQCARRDEDEGEVRS
jgi:uncharacterized protein YecE (DUF72 family)